MTRDIAAWVVSFALLCATAFIVGGAETAAAQSNDIDEVADTNGLAPKLQLTPAQRSAIYQAVQKDRSKVSPSHFATNVGAEVPPMIELYALPDEIVANNPVTKFYKFTRVEDQVVLVDPTKMQVIAVIGPKAAR
jgi:hypothetical protein